MSGAGARELRNMICHSPMQPDWPAFPCRRHKSMKMASLEPENHSCILEGSVLEVGHSCNQRRGCVFDGLYVLHTLASTSMLLPPGIEIQEQPPLLSICHSEMASTSPSESAIIRRVAASRKLEKQIPRINLVSIIIRVAQFLTLCGFTLAYAMSQPPVYLDIFVWPQNTAPPYEMTVYRDTTSYGGIWAERFSVDSPNYSAVAFLWNHSLPPAGLSETHVCTHGPRWGCDGTQWAATRIGWSDSWPFGASLEVEAPGMTYIDRYIFWLLVVGVSHSL